MEIEKLFEEEELYTLLKDYAASHNMEQTLCALPCARKLHQGQFRRGGDHAPYIIHPMLVAYHAIAMGLEDDDLLATALLHDVCEDCSVLPQELPVCQQVREGVALLSRNLCPKGKEELTKEAYFAGISENPIAVMVKLLDRCNNVSTMVSGFSREGVLRYIEETETFIYPMMEKAQEKYPQYRQQIFLIKYHMMSVIESLKRKV